MFKKLRRRYQSFKQTLKQGFPDSDLWNLDVTFAKFILPRLKRYKIIKHGYPGELTPIKWEAKIDQMIQAFELSLSDRYVHLVNKKQEQQINTGLRLFAKYYRALWD